LNEINFEKCNCELQLQDFIKGKHGPHPLNRFVAFLTHFW